jgi:hypothetical protein
VVLFKYKNTSERYPSPRSDEAKGHDNISTALVSTPDLCWVAIECRRRRQELKAAKRVKRKDIL